MLEGGSSILTGENKMYQCVTNLQTIGTLEMSQRPGGKPSRLPLAPRPDKIRKGDSCVEAEFHPPRTVRKTSQASQNWPQ